MCSHLEDVDQSEDGGATAVVIQAHEVHLRRQRLAGLQHGEVRLPRHLQRATRACRTSKQHTCMAQFELVLDQNLVRPLLLDVTSLLHATASLACSGQDAKQATEEDCFRQLPTCSAGRCGCARAGATDVGGGGEGTRKTGSSGHAAR